MGETGQEPPVIMSAGELLAKDLPPETAEEAYRRGYRDGFIVAVQAFYDSLTAGRLPSERATVVMEALANFHDEVLLEWQRDDRSEVVPPPQFERLEPSEEP